MRGVLTAALLVFVGCADPAALEVRVDVEVGSLAPGTISALRVRVQTGLEVLVDCHLPPSGAPQGTCPFDAGTLQWNEGEALRFVLYGDPGQSATITIGAKHDGRTVTATTAQVYLPDLAGERRALNLILAEPATPQAECSLDLLGGTNIASAVLPPLASLFEARDVLVSAGPSLHRVSYQRDSVGTCKLTETPLLDSEDPTRPAFTWCRLRAGSLVVRRQEAEPSYHLVAGVCASLPVARPQRTVVMAKLWADGRVQIRKTLVSAGRDAPSDPVLADTDGDGQMELVLLWWVRNHQVLLRRYALVNGGVVTLAETGTSAATLLDLPNTVPDAQATPFAPIILPPALGISTETIVFVGYGGAGQYSNRRVGGFGIAENIPERVSLRPSVAYRLDAGRFVIVTQPSACRLVRALLVASGRQWQLSEVDLVEIPICRSGPGLFSLDPLTIGRRKGRSAPSVALSIAGRTYLGDLELSSRPVEPYSGTNRSVDTKLLALNLDGVTGTDLLTFSLADQGVELSYGAGIRGWPRLLTGSILGQYLAADLDGAEPEFGLRNLEIISHSGRGLQVISLGPGSYDADGMDWPSARQSSHGALVWMDGSAPTLRP